MNEYEDIAYVHWEDSVDTWQTTWSKTFLFSQ